jgi:hypothetical protein
VREISTKNSHASISSWLDTRRDIFFHYGGFFEKMEGKRNALEVLSNRIAGGYSTMSQVIPTFTDLHSTSEIAGEGKKLEVATVPE